MRVEAVHTPLPMAEVRTILRAAHRDVFGSELGRAEPYLLALLALENAHGSAILNHNWGNLTITEPSFPHYVVGTNPRLFAAFDSHEDGAHAYLQRLASQTHQRILEAAHAGDFDAFFRGLYSPHPVTGKAYCPDCRPLRKTYRQLVRQFSVAGQLPLDSATQRKTGRGGGGLFLLATVLAVGGTVAYHHRTSLKRLLGA